MSSTPQAYDALPSETSSTSPTLSPPENQPDSKKAGSSKVSLTSSLPSSTSVSKFWTSWEWEFAACFLVLAIPVFIFATLYTHSGQPLPQWPFRVSINSLLSIYALVLKAATGFLLTSCIGQLQWAWFSETRPLTDMLRFDSATRGADGALELIWRQRFRQPLTALGCIIMVLSVALDPFVQQLVRPVDCSVELLDNNAAATLPRTNVFEDGCTGNSSTRQYTESTEVVNKVIEGVLYAAIFNPEQGPPWQCSTSNCTFQDNYGTLGFCYSCKDVSADVIINATCSRHSSSYASQHPTSGWDCPADSDFIVESNITVGENVKLGTKMNVSSHGNFDTAVFADAYADGGTWEESEIDSRGLLFGFLVGATANAGGRIDWTTSDRLVDGKPDDNLACSPDDPKEYWPCQGYGAASCSLGPCVQIYNATISAGVLEEHLVASSSGISWGTIYGPDGSALYSSLVDTQCPAAIETLSDRDTSVGSRWLPYNLTLTEADVMLSDLGSIMSFHLRLPDDIKSLLDSGCLYLLSASSTKHSIQRYLSGAVEDEVAIGMTSSGHGSGSMLIYIEHFQGPEVVRNIYNWGLTDFERVQSVVANISDSLTTYIRTHGGNPPIPGGTKLPTDVKGKIYHYATCLQVEWPWLSYPASLVVLTTLFFLMVVKATRRQGNSVWKASPLAWVLRVEGPGNEILPSSRGSCETLKDRSTRIAVHLFDGDIDGPRIRMADLKDPNLL